MPMNRGTALVADIESVVQLTGVQDLTNLEADNELVVSDLLVSASDAIYDQLERDGIDPTKLTNQRVFERAVAWHFLGILTINGYLPLIEGKEPPDSAYDWSDPYYMHVRPRLSDGDEGRMPGEVVPKVANLYRYPNFNRDTYHTQRLRKRS